MDTEQQAPPTPRRWSLMHSIHDTPEVRAQRRRDTRRIWQAGFALVIGSLILALAFSYHTPDAGAATTPTAKVTCNPTCQLNRRLTAVCPVYPAMTRPRCVQWVQVAQCETGGQQYNVSLVSIAQIGWRTDGAFDGGLQFRRSTWTSNVARIPAVKLTRPQRQARAAGRYAFAYNAPPSVQILAAEVLRVRIGGNPEQTAGWPHCGAWWYNRPT